MGVDGQGVGFLLLARALGVDFTSTVTIGRQAWTANQAEYERALAVFRRGLDAGPVASGGPSWRPGPDLDGLVVRRGRFAEPFLERLGAHGVDSVDASDFEGATIIHDLNEPLPDEHGGRFTAVLDGGALEHVFDVPSAIDNLMRLVAPGGHLLSIAPCNDQVGHGFYQFSPELYFRTLCRENGFEVRLVLMHVGGARSRWFRVADPAATGRRLETGTSGAADLYVLARRVGDAGLNVVPQQSDYAQVWSAGDGAWAAPERRPGLKERVYAKGGPAVAALRRVRRIVRPLAGSGLEPVELAGLLSHRDG